MGTTIAFEPYGGGPVMSTRNFSPGQKIRVVGHDTGQAGIGEPFQAVQLQITPPNNEFMPIFLENNTDIVGTWWFDVQLPNVTSQATVTASVNFSVSGNTDVATVPIAIGNVQPVPASTLPSQDNWPILSDIVNNLFNWKTFLIVGVIVAGIVFYEVKKK